MASLFFGQDFAKIAYNHIRNSHPVVKWGKWIWSPFIPLRKSLTLWRAINDKLLSWDKLHFEGPSICPLCFKAEENIDHLFVSCDFAQQIWQKVLSAFDIAYMPQSSFGEFFITAMKLIFSPQILSLWRAVFVNVIWNIWNSRNRVIFDNCKPSAWFVTASLWADMQETNSSPLVTCSIVWTICFVYTSFTSRGTQVNHLAFKKFAGNFLLLVGSNVTRMEVLLELLVWRDAVEFSEIVVVS